MYQWSYCSKWSDQCVECGRLETTGTHLYSLVNTVSDFVNKTNSLSNVWDLKYIKYTSFLVMLVTYLINEGIVLSNGDNARKQFILTNLCSNVKEAFRHILNSLKSVHRINQEQEETTWACDGIRAQSWHALVDYKTDVLTTEPRRAWLNTMVN